MTTPMNPFLEEETSARETPVNPYLSPENEEEELLIAPPRATQRASKTVKKAVSNTDNSSQQSDITVKKTADSAVQPQLEQREAARRGRDDEARGTSSTPFKMPKTAVSIPDLDVETDAVHHVKSTADDGYVRAPELPKGVRNRAQEYLDAERKAAFSSTSIPFDESGLVEKYLFKKALTREELDQLTPEQRDFIHSTPPVYMKKEYRDLLTPEQKAASKKRRLDLEEDQKYAKKIAYAQGKRPWEEGKTRSSVADRKRKRDSGETPPGHKKQPKYSSYSRRDLTEKDLLTFLLTAKFRYITPKILARVLGVKYQTAHKRLRGLEELGFLNASNPGMGKFWHLKKAAINTLDLYGWERPRATIFNPETSGFDFNGMAHHLALAWGAVELSLGNVPSKRTLPTFEEWVQLIPEHEMRSARQNIGGNEAMRKDKKAAVEQVLNGEQSWEDFYAENPSRWILPGSDLHKINLKIPDFAINLTRHQKGDEPMNAAVEVELTRKSPREYRDIFRAYSYDKHTYGGVIYMVNNEATGEFIKKIAREERFKRLMVVPLLDEHGDYLTRPIELVKWD